VLHIASSRLRTRTHSTVSAQCSQIYEELKKKFKHNSA